MRSRDQIARRLLKEMGVPPPDEEEQAPSRGSADGGPRGKPVETDREDDFDAWIRKAVWSRRG